jgi:hypothetical protein
MAITISDTTITGVGVGGLPNEIINISTFANSTRRWKTAVGTSTSTPGGQADTGWISHVSVTFTVTEASSTVMIRYDGCHGYEQGAGNVGGYAVLSGATSASGSEMQICKQGYSNNFAFGSHCYNWVFTGCATGSTTCTFYCRNWNAIAYANYFSPGYSNTANLQAYYL